MGTRVNTRRKSTKNVSLNRKKIGLPEVFGSVPRQLLAIVPLATVIFLGLVYLAGGFPTDAADAAEQQGSTAGESSVKTDDARADEEDSSEDGGDDTEGSDTEGNEDEDDGAEISPLSVNAACYVCHIPFVRDSLAKTHLKKKVTCVKCHGTSAKHANDENIGATKPDITFKRGQIDRMCEECHEEHDAPANKIIERFLERKLSPKKPAVCTDCHGTHRIERPDESELETPEEPKT